MRLKAFRTGIAAVFPLLQSDAIACTCVPFDEARVATSYKNIYVFEVGELTLLEKIKKLLSPSSKAQDERYPIKVIQAIKGEVAVKEIFRSREGICGFGDLEPGMRVLIYTDDDGKQYIGSCNSMHMGYASFDGEKAIRAIKDYMAVTDVPFQKNELKKWRRVPKSKGEIFEITNPKSTDGTYELRIAEPRAESNGATYQKHRSSVYGVTLDCKNWTYKLGDEYFYADVDLQGRRVEIHNLNRRGQRFGEMPNWYSISKDGPLTHLARLACKVK